MPFTFGVARQSIEGRGDGSLCDPPGAGALSPLVPDDPKWHTVPFGSPGPV